jgi:hypothetical protein
MADFNTFLNRWQDAGILDASTASRIRAYEAKRAGPAGIRWQGIAALILGAILLACGVVLFVNAHWDRIAPAWRFALVMAMVALFHLAGGLARDKFHGLSTALHAVGTASTGAAIALTGQIFNIQEHWPAAILMWALAAAVGWALLHDEVQQTLTLLLIPAWMISEFSYYSENHIGQGAYVGRFMFVWAVLYLTFLLGSRRRAVQGILFAVSAVAAIAGVVLMLEGWRSWGAMPSLPWGLRVWGWAAIAALPLVVALVRLTRSFIPVAAAVAFTIALPWCNRVWTDRYTWGPDPGQTNTFTHNEPNLAAHALVAAFAVFLIWWGVRQSSKALVNFGIVGFAIAVGWFYFSDIFDKVGRSLGLIGLGVLFLAGGWLLEKMRRRLIGTMGAGTIVSPAASGPAPKPEVAS